MHTEKKEAGLSTRPSPVFEQLLLSYCSVTQPNSVALGLRDNFVQLEDRQEHRDHDSADDYAEENDQEWFNQRSECVQHRFNFFVPEIGPPTMSSTSRIGTPLRINCAKVRAKRDMQIL